MKLADCPVRIVRDGRNPKSSKGAVEAIQQPARPAALEELHARTATPGDDSASRRGSNDPDLRARRAAYMRAWRAKNRQRCRELDRAWRERNRELRREINRRWKAKQRASPGFKKIAAVFRARPLASNPTAKGTTR